MKVIIILLMVTMIGIIIFSGSILASSSGSEHRTSMSQRLGDDTGNASDEPDHHRLEQRSRAEDS